MKVVLAEKPSVARDIAQYLRANRRHEGYLEGNGWAITWAFGHMVELCEPEAYDPKLKAWRLDTLPILPPAFKLRPRADASALQQLQVIQTLFRQAEEIVCATDAGREGELIFRYILTWTQCESKPCQRLWIRSLTAQAIAAGFADLKPGHQYDALYAAAKCRSEADWIVGMNGTRFYTIEYGGRNQLWSIGRVQTPILAMIVGRDHAIDNFVPEDYWEVHTLYRTAKFKHTAGKFKQRDQADAIQAKTHGHDLTIEKVARKKELAQPPLLFDLTELQRAMNRRYGFTAEQTLRLAQSLYEKKHITYPRTDSRHLSKDLQAHMASLLAALQAVQGEAIQKIDLANLSFSNRIINDKKVSDHHAIIPTDVVPRQLPDAEMKVYEAIVIRLIAAFYPPCVKAVTVVDAHAAGEPFRARGVVLVDPGWQALYPHMHVATRKHKGASANNTAEAQVMPDFQEGEQGPHQPSVEAFKTSPPKHFNEASLLQLMETAGKTVEDETLREALKDKGVGTPATRAGIIEVLIQRQYIERKRKSLLSTESGRQLIAHIRDERLKSPELTGDWEFRLKQVERGAYAPATFMQEVTAYTRELLQDTAAKSIDVKNLGPCPLCGKPVMRGKKGYGCSHWKQGCPFTVLDGEAGLTLKPVLFRELLLNQRSLRAHRCQVAGKPSFGHLVLTKEGALTVEPVKQVKKQKDETSLGKCPTCGSDVVVGKKAYGCANWRQGCRFVIWKKIAQKSISQTVAKSLLQRGETDALEGFQSKAGKPFTAKLKLVNNEVKFEFLDG